MVNYINMNIVDSHKITSRILLITMPCPRPREHTWLDIYRLVCFIYLHVVEYFPFHHINNIYARQFFWECLSHTVQSLFFPSLKLENILSSDFESNETLKCYGYRLMHAQSQCFCYESLFMKQVRN